MKNEQYILFEKYINNELEKKELELFHQQLKTNTDFKQEFEIYKDLDSSLSSTYKNKIEEKKLRNTLSKLGTKYVETENFVKKETKVISILRYKKLMVAASIALLIGFFLFNNQKPVYSNYAIHPNLELVVRGANNPLFLKAEKAFNSKNYNEALKHLTVLSNIYINDTEIKLYKGIALLELGNYNKAEGIFNTISLGSSAFVNTALWYKALSNLKQKKYKKAKSILKTIPKSAAVYEQAQKLLKKL